jgi:hypothetical protein
LDICFGENQRNEYSWPLLNLDTNHHPQNPLQYASTLQDPRIIQNKGVICVNQQQQQQQVAAMSNALYGTAMNWMGDGKDGASLEIRGTVLDVRGGTPGTPLNLRMDLQTPRPDYYIQVGIPEMTQASSLSVGIVAPAEFQTGWKTKGMFYNGNLTNGSCALSIQWGPRFGVGDSVGVRVITTNDNVEVIFYKNGISLGTGFLIENHDILYCPCIQVDGDVTLAIEVPKELPSKEFVPVEDVDMPGPWKLVEAVTGDGTVLNLPGRPATMDMARDGDTVHMNLRVGNPIHGHAKIVAGNNGPSWTLEMMGPMISGRMLPPPVFRDIETLLCGLEANALSLEDGRLTISNGPKKMVWERNPREPLALPNYNN